MTTMIALVGEQPMPNFLPIRHYQPKDVLLIYTTKTKQKYEHLKATLQRNAHTVSSQKLGAQTPDHLVEPGIEEPSLPDSQCSQATLPQIIEKTSHINIYGLETDPFDISSVAKAIDEKLDELAAKISQPLVFNLTGGTKAMMLAAYQIAKQYNAAMMYLQSEGKQTRVYHYIWEHQQSKAKYNELLPECIRLKDVFDLYFGPGNWQECGPGRNNEGGGPFEAALANELRSHRYEVMVGIRAMNGQIDVDIAVRSGNQYGIIEAKMGSRGRELKGIQQLSTAARHLGTFMQSFYAITVPPEPNHKAITAASSIQVISLPGYNTDTNILSATDVTELLDKVGKTLKG